MARSTARAPLFPILFVLFLFAAGCAKPRGGKPAAEANEANEAKRQPLAQALPPGFQETLVLSGRNNPTALRFAPNGQVFVAEKSGLVWVYDDIASPGTARRVIDLRVAVHNFWDRGLLGLAVHPNYPATPEIYVLYSHDAFADGRSPRWGSANPEASTEDTCPNPPGDTADGCVVYGRLSRVTIDVATMTGTEQPLLASNWCQQYPSHSIGDLVFGRDGYLYMSAGDGASFNFADFGQDGDPRNPCGDPPSGVGGVNEGPSAEGGALRSQDLLSTGDPTTFDGAVLRVDVSTTPVSAPPNNPLVGNERADDDFIVAVGLRNPFRINRRPGTDEIWIADVGWGAWEELNRIATPTGPVQNFGWPCYEGAPRQGSYEGQALCQKLYSGPLPANMQVAPPHYAYRHSDQVVAGELCGSGSSSITGVAFNDGTAYPADYAGAVFFADSSRRCVWTMFAGTDGQPDPTRRAPLVSIASGRIVDIQLGPDKRLYYVDLDGGNVYRIDHFAQNEPPLAQVSATPTNGVAPLSVAFSAAASRDAEDGTALTFAWDLDGDGAFDDGTGATQSRVYDRAGVFRVRVRVTDSGGASATAEVSITAGNTAPVPFITTPTAALDWTVGSNIAFSGGANDAQDGPLPASQLTWQLILHHCYTLDDCHTHAITSAAGVASGSFTAPDHEYPSFLEVALSARDLVPADWFDGAWTKRLPLVVDGAGLTETLTDVPVLVRLDPTRVTYADIQSGGRDLRFVSETGAVLAHEIDTWAAGGVSAVWVKVPSVAAGTGARIFMYYGNPTTTSDGQNAAGVWSPGFAAAWHLGPSLGNSTGLTAAGTNVGAVASSGFIGGAFTFDGASSRINMGKGAALDLTSTFSLEAWVKVSDPNQTGSPRVLSKKNVWDEAAGYNLEYKPAENNVTTVGSGGDYVRADGIDLDTAWHYLATTGSGATGEVFVDGVARTTDASLSPIVPSAYDLLIGSEAGGANFLGAIDEVRISTVRRSAAWFALQHRSMTDALIAYGAPQAPTTLSATTSVQMQPRTVALTIASSPPGATVSVGPFTKQTPFDVTLIVGSQSSVSITSPQNIAGVTYNFASWSDGGGASHQLTVPGAPTTYTAQLTPAANQLPIVSITSPAGGASVTGPVVSVAVSAVDPEGPGITRVEVLADGVVVGSDATAPYVVAWSAAVGLRRVSARAIDADGGVGTSAVIDVHVGVSPDHDGDGDGMPDVWEVTYGLDPASAADGAGDLDGDALTNASEHGRGTRPNDADSDDDTWADGFEVTFGSDPLAATSAPPPPTALISSPTAGATVVGSSVTVTASMGGTLRPGDHLHIALDDRPVVMVHDATASHTFTGVTLGTHTLVVEVASGQHAPYVTIDATRYAAARRAITFSTSTTAPVGTGLRGEYFGTRTFTDVRATRTDPGVGFDWGNGAPAAGMPTDQFSVRWTGQVEAQHSETYTFVTRSDDGVRLWVGGQLLVDNWTDHAPADNSGTITLVAGQRYDVRLEYYEAGGGAVMQLSWQSPSQPRQLVPAARLYPDAVAVACTTDAQCAPQLCGGGGTCSGAAGTGLAGVYFDNVDFTAQTLSRTDAGVTFDWGAGAPATGVGADTFSVRWTGQVRPRHSETYTFTTRSDDGVRLWVNGVLLVDNWTDHGATDNSGTIALTGGQLYDVRMEYYERGGGAIAQLSWQSPSQARELVPAARLYPTAVTTGTGLRGVYYDNVDFTGAQQTRVDPAVAFSWGTGAPMTSMGVDTFSVRWTGQVKARVSETYTFSTTSDDGVRLWVNGALLIDNWTDHAPVQNSGTIALTAGASYDVRLDYYERTGGAAIDLSWQSPSQPREVVPQAQLTPPP